MSSEGLDRSALCQSGAVTAPKPVCLPLCSALRLVLIATAGLITSGLAFSAAVAQGSHARPVLPGIVGADERQPVDASDWPWSAIGRINIAGREKKQFCTGTLIGQRHVLTAAQCLIHPRAGRVLPHAIHFVAGYRRGEHLAHSVAERVICGAGEACQTGSGRIKGRWAPQQDWAIVVLRDALDIRPVPLAPSVGEGQTVTRAGYGRDRAHMLSVHSGCRVQPLRGSEPLVEHDCDATQGDSGSPLLAGSGEDVRVAALHIGYSGSGASTQGVAIVVEAFAPALHALLDS